MGAVGIISLVAVGVGLRGFIAREVVAVAERASGGIRHARDLSLGVVAERKGAVVDVGHLEEESGQGVARIIQGISVSVGELRRQKGLRGGIEAEGLILDMRSVLVLFAQSRGRRVGIGRDVHLLTVPNHQFKKFPMLKFITGIIIKGNLGVLLVICMVFNLEFPLFPFNFMWLTVNFY